MADEIEDAEFFRLVGLAITMWAGIESKVFRCFRILLHTDRQFAAILFYRPQSLSFRFETFDELMKAAFPSKDHALVEEWRGVKRATDKLLKFRNMLAHHDVSKVGRDGESWIQIGYSENQRYRGKTIEIERIKTADLEKHMVELHSLFTAATDFMQHLKAALPEEPIQQEFREKLGLGVPTT